MEAPIKVLEDKIKEMYAVILDHNTVIAKTGNVMQWRIDELKQARKVIAQMRKAIRILKALSVDDIKVEHLQNEN
jgi:hypothetical protein